ncbi:hypothetical protein BpHYR1_052687 [Brachionus plicatilis]|uniref:Uncharacterized protein n=1 Tax=Brachionus plicatilis TaxID=10195 RepID=A0A3M7Q6W2_BRAPC|nr:hypothetical protein BpHYR1_052687 [Brachionus plicatilis]
MAFLRLMIERGENIKKIEFIYLIRMAKLGNLSKLINKNIHKPENKNISHNRSICSGLQSVQIAFSESETINPKSLISDSHSVPPV